MPRSHQETSRSCGKAKEKRRSLGDYRGFEPPRFDTATPAINSKNDVGRELRREEPCSPEQALTPRVLVPPACFPPAHPRAFASFSESAQPGGWPDEIVAGKSITDLVASLETMTIPAAESPRLQTSIQMRLSYGQDRKGTIWNGEQQTPNNREEREQQLARRASFCGVMPLERNGCGTLHWKGLLPMRSADTSGGFSPKVFLGGLPKDISEHALAHALRHFGPVRVEWPGRDSGGVGGPRGFAYVTLKNEGRVRALLAASRHHGGNWFYRVSSRKTRSKEVQVIPWSVSDASWVSGGSVRLEPSRTVFVGALHGMLSAHALAIIMNDLFQGVVYAGIDTDKNKYPIGSGRVTFNNVHSYLRAVSAAHIKISTDKFNKKVQVDPYIEDSMCSVCNLQQGPYFCREPNCFRYFCRGCWQRQHAGGVGGAPGAPGEEHRPLTRNCRAALRPDLSVDYSTCNLNFHTNSEGTGSPSMNGTSGTNGTSASSELEQAEHSELALTCPPPSPR